MCIKIISLDKFNKKHTLDDQRTEVEIISKCLHPNILRYYTSFLNQKELWIVQPLIQNGTLRQVMDMQATKGIQDEHLAVYIIK